MNDINKHFPLILLASLWGAVSITLSFFETINSRRDRMFELIDKCGQCIEQTLGPIEIYFTNLLPLTIGLIIFLGLIVNVVFSIPRYMKIENETEAKRMKRACMAITILPAFGLLAFAAGGIFDITMLIRSL